MNYTASMRIGLEGDDCKAYLLTRDDSLNAIVIIVDAEAHRTFESSCRMKELTNKDEDVKDVVGYVDLSAIEDIQQYCNYPLIMWYRGEIIRTTDNSEVYKMVDAWINDLILGKLNEEIEIFAEKETCLDVFDTLKLMTK